ncbi:hypothetical protein I7I50_10559 [Histoplasma capsulatum G186AR]|uniref:Uncharacterized protein n=1 Tax=Ajellomyces capsulatus TaxID=5037 RepID=A0A8H7Z3Y0_AJECA|nr:hypothetical protein I7I52_01798 [Histoplasma capsulatum]QSS69311.1 hypothetical protein I7I50_10559 [Histoplasma capsulatum G186AR]
MYCTCGMWVSSMALMGNMIDYLLMLACGPPCACQEKKKKRKKKIETHRLKAQEFVQIVSSYSAWVGAILTNINSIISPHRSLEYSKTQLCPRSPVHPSFLLGGYFQKNFLLVASVEGGKKCI